MLLLLLLFTSLVFGQVDANPNSRLESDLAILENELSATIIDLTPVDDTVTHPSSERSTNGSCGSESTFVALLCITIFFGGSALLALVASVMLHRLLQHTTMTHDGVYQSLDGKQQLRLSTYERAILIAIALATVVAVMVTAIILSVNSPTTISVDSNVARATLSDIEIKGTVFRLYRAFFLRSPDRGGFNYWVGKMRTGTTATAIATSFSSSREFKSRYGSLNNDQYVRLLYDNVLERDADAGGLRVWVTKLNAGTSRGSIMLSFSNSPEYRRKVDTEFQIYIGATTTQPSITPSTASTSLSTTNSPTAAAGQYPFVASLEQRTGESWADACVRHMSFGYNGCVRYYPEGKTFSWDAEFRSLASRTSDRVVNIQLTAKTNCNSCLENVIVNLPAKWKSAFIYNIYQEPEDNLSTPAQWAKYKQMYKDAATVTRRLGVQLPWVEWQEWTVDPVNTRGWDLRNFQPAASDFGGVLWSFFEYNERDRDMDHKIARVKAAMAKYATGKPFALMASAYTLEGTITDAKYRAQAAWLKSAYTKLKQAGSQGFAWFNLLWPGSGGASGEARLDRNPYAKAWMMSL